MGYAKDQIDKNVMKVIRKMAAVEREEISLISENKKIQSALNRNSRIS